MKSAVARLQVIFFLHAVIQTHPQRSLQKTDHGGHNAARLYEIDLLLKDQRRIVIEPNDKTTLAQAKVPQPSSKQT